MAKLAGSVSFQQMITRRAQLKVAVLQAIQERLALLKSTQAVTQTDVAARIAMDPGQFSRSMNGRTDFQIDTLADIALAMGCRVRIELVPLDEEAADHSTTLV